MQMSQNISHQTKIARKTLQYSCEGAQIMGGMTHIEAAEFLNRPLPKWCTCKKEGRNEN